MTKVKLQKFISVILMICLAFMMGPVASMAAEDTRLSEKNVTMIQPRLTYIVDAECDFSIVGTTATVDCRVTGDYGEATKAKVIAELQVKSGSSWIAYGTWVDTQNDYEAYVYETKSVTKGNTYRVKATYTVWEGSASEDLVIFSEEKTA